MKVMTRSRAPAFTGTWKALVAWVMPPASPAATFVLRMRSRSDVLPWSTCPRIVTTGARGRTSTGVRSAKRCSITSPAERLAVTSSSMPKSIMTSIARSGSIALFTVIGEPISMNFLRISACFTPVASESSRTVTGSATTTAPPTSFGVSAL